MLPVANIEPCFEPEEELRLPSFLEPRRMAEKALTGVIQVAESQGFRHRRVDDLVKAMGMLARRKVMSAALAARSTARACPRA